MKILKILLLFAVTSVSAQTFRGVEPRVIFAPDTTHLKAIGIGFRDGDRIYLEKLSSANSNGGGVFVKMDSAYQEGEYAFDVTDSAGNQWVRVDYLLDNEAYLEWFGAKGDGSTDDSLAIYNAFNSGEHLVGKSGKTYKLNGRVSITDQNISIRPSGRGRFIFDFGSEAGGLNFSGSATGDTSALAADMWQGVNYAIITAGEGGDFAAGNLIRIVAPDSNNWYVSGSNRDRGEQHLIDSVLAEASGDNDTLFLQGKIWDDYQTSEATWSVIEYSPVTVEISGMEISYDSYTNGAYGIDIEIAKNNRVDNCKIDGAAARGIQFWRCYDNLLRDSDIFDVAQSDLGYGAFVYSSSYTRIDNCNFQGCLKAIEISSSSVQDVPSREIQIIGGTIDGAGFDDDGQDLYTTETRGIHTHSGAEGIDVIGTLIENCYYGVRLGGLDLSMSDVTLGGKMAYGVFVNTGGGIDIDGCRYNSGLAHRDTVGFKMTNFVYIKNNAENDTNLVWRVTNSEVYGISSSLVFQQKDSLYNMDISRNTVVFDDTTGQTNYILGGSNRRLRSTIAMNNARALRGSVTTFQGAISNSRVVSWNDDNILTLEEAGLDIADSTRIGGGTWLNKAEIVGDTLFVITGTDTCAVKLDSKRSK